MMSKSSLDTINMSTSTESEAMSLDSIPLYNIANLLWMVCPPVILLFGIFGNVMTLVIMYRMTSSIKDSSTVPLYFTSIALVDLIGLFTAVLPQWMLSAFQYDLIAVHSLVCKLFMFLQLASGTAACWYLVLLSLHRAVSVVWPHRVNLVCTRRMVLVLLSTITVFLAALYSHCLYGFDVIGNSYCMITDEEYIQFTVNVFVYMELVVYCLLPFVCLVLTNGVLVWKLTTSVKQAGQGLTSGSSANTLTREKAAQSVTLTVVLVSLTFLLLTLPWTVYVMLFYKKPNEHKGHQYARVHFFRTAAYILAYSNSAVSFYLYCLTGRRFREEFLKVVQCWKKGAGKERETD